MWKILAIITIFGILDVSFVWLTKNDQQPAPAFKTVAKKVQAHEHIPTPSANPAKSQTEPKVSPISAPQTVRLPILTYHYIRTLEHPEQDPMGVGLSVSPEMFRQQLSYLRDQGYKVIRLEALDRVLKGTETLDPKPVALTFDDGYEDFYTQALPILKEFNFPVTLFTVAGFLDNPSGRYLSTNQLKEITQTGLVTIGVHSYTHPDLTKPRVNLNKEIVEAKSKLEEIVGKKLDLFAYPYGAYNSKIREEAKNAGFTLSFSTEGGFVQTEANRYHLHRNHVSSSLRSLIGALGN